LGTGAFALASLPTLFSENCPTTRIFISSAAVFTWSTKLAGFLFFRALKLKTDGRLHDTLSTVNGTFGFWLISFLWGVICSLPHTLGATSSATGSSVSLILGGILYLLGLVTESMADYQKWIFKNNHPGKFCNVGLWSISQHPNFFGNLLLWSGILIMNSDSLVERGMSSEGSSGGGGVGILSFLWSARRLFVAFLSPLFMWTLFSGQANGSLTNAVELAHKKYGNDPKFQEYVQTVPKIIPNLACWLK
jgi:steroid 5-alpha reductase family enzyme